MESPEYVRLSLAAAMTLGFAPGTFYRGACLRCINLLLTYEAGCTANCAFCGLAREKKQRLNDKKFIRVSWKTYSFRDVLQALKQHPEHVERICISMLTHPRCRQDVLALTRDIRQLTDLPVSLLISPTILNRDDLKNMKAAGADRIGVAIDAATPDLFNRLRGHGVNGPHRWDHYWKIFEQSLDVFGPDMAGTHLIVGLGETEREMVECISHTRKLGGFTHLFSFFPEYGSALADHQPPPLGQYRRIQIARYLIDKDLSSMDSWRFGEDGCILDFGYSKEALWEILKTGEAFETSGCPGASGRTACNRPFANERPGDVFRNFPFLPKSSDLADIRTQIWPEN